ncbi:MAG: hypothetical protein AAGA60_27955 [Cyanobacteria bacterium P01_E01_bin.42]
MVRMVASSAEGIVFPLLDEDVTSKTTFLPFGYSLSGIIWLFKGSRSLIDNLDLVHPSISFPLAPYRLIPSSFGFF